MPSDPNEDLPEAVALFLVGMAVPIVAVVPARELLALYLSGTVYTALAAAAFAVVAWTLLEERNLDRPNFAVASVVGPFLFFVAIIVYGVLTKGYADPFQYLFADGGYMGYPAAFGAAGFLAVALSKRFRSLTAREPRVPRARTVAAGVAVAAAVALALGLGANLVAASAVSVTSVDSGVETMLDPALNVTLEGGPADVRVRVTAPDGTTVRKRLPRAETGDEPTTVPFRVWFDDSPPPGRLPAQAGTYRVEVVALSGVTVDSATFEAEGGGAVSIAKTAAGSGDLPWNRSADVVVGNARHDTGVGVVVANRGAFHTRLDVTLETPDGLENHHARAFFAEPGARVVVVFRVPDDAAETIRAEHGGRVTVAVSREFSGDRVATTEVELPARDTLDRSTRIGSRERRALGSPPGVGTVQPDKYLFVHRPIRG